MGYDDWNLPLKEHSLKKISWKSKVMRDASHFTPKMLVYGKYDLNCVFPGYCHEFFFQLVISFDMYRNH